MADDAAAPGGELTESPSEPSESPGTDDADAVDAASDESVDEPDAVSDDAVSDDAVSDDAVSDDAVSDDAVSDDAVSDDAVSEEASAKPRMSHVRLATIAGLVFVLALAGLTGWLGFGAYQSHQTDEQHKLFVQVARQGALNLTTIDWQKADGDVQRILDSATGTFYDDFQKRAGPFVEVVKQAQSKSTGTIAEAGLESASGEEARVLVAVTVQSSNAGAPEQQPRAWRMRLTVEKTGEDEAKVSNVDFVP
jgi:Mce-associated membrane protein